MASPKSLWDRYPTVPTVIPLRESGGPPSGPWSTVILASRLADRGRAAADPCCGARAGCAVRRLGEVRRLLP